MLYSVGMQTVVTHDGSFDPDDVLAAATIELFLGIENTKIIRSRDEAVIAAADWVIDVGGKYDAATRRFDHHQNGVPHRENKVPYSSFGLVWRELGVEICGSQEIADYIEHKLVQPIDSADNQIKVCQPNAIGVEAFEFFDVIDAFKPVWDSEEDFDTGFIRATAFARKLLRRLVLRGKGEFEMRKLVEETYEAAADKTSLVFEKPVPREALVAYPNVQVFVSPVFASHSENWMAVVVPESIVTYKNRLDFPLAWAGFSDGELAEISGLPDAVFCHKSRYLFVSSTKAGALAAAKIVQDT